LFGDLCAQAFTKACGDGRKGFADRGKGLISIRDWQIDQVDIDGEPRQIADEQIDRSAALQRKRLFMCDFRDGPDEQFCLSGVEFGRH